MLSFNSLMKLSFIGVLITIFICSFISDGLHEGEGYHYSDKVAVLEYHHIDSHASAYTITPDMFRQHLAKLKENHYNIISMKQLLNFEQGQGPVPPDSVLLTFDDGYESFYKYAYPILKSEGLTATNFLIVSYLGTSPGIAFLNWSEIDEMYHDGFSFYSHTYRLHNDSVLDRRTGRPINPLTDHLYLEKQGRKETESEYEQRVTADLEKAQQIIDSKLGPQDKLFCLPHGRFNSELLKITDKVGIKYIFTGIEGLNSSGTKMVRRINAGSAKITAAKLLRKLNDESTLIGQIKITLKNWINVHRMTE